MRTDRNKKISGNNKRKRRLFKSDNRKDRKVLIIAIGIVSALLVIFAVGIATSLKIKTRTYIIEYANLPMKFDGYKIVQITDYHKGVYGNTNEALISAVQAAEPDIIVLTGDIIDNSSKDINSITQLCESLTETAPVLWIKGNHFYKSDEALSAELEETLEDMGVTSLVNECYIVTRDGENIKFCGVDDPENYYSGQKLPKEYSKRAGAMAMERFLKLTEESSNGENGFKILLSHRYTIYDKFPEYGYSLALAGHSHGGQLKLPGGIDLFGSNLELFPKVKSGYNNIDSMPLIVSSGLGTSNLNIRLYNPPEIILIQLKNK